MPIRVTVDDYWNGPSERLREANLVPAILFAVPALGGLLCAALAWGLRPLLPRWRALGWLPSFVAAVGIGAGCAATAMHVRGERLASLHWLYDVPYRPYRQTVDTLRSTQAVDRDQHAKRSDERGDENG